MHLTKSLKRILIILRGILTNGVVIATLTDGMYFSYLLSYV